MDWQSSLPFGKMCTSREILNGILNPGLIRHQQVSPSLRDPEGRLTKWELHLESPTSSEELDKYLLVLRSKNVFDLMIRWKFLIFLPNRHGNREFSGTPEPELIRLNETRVAQVPALVLPSGQRLCLGPISISCELFVFGTQTLNTSGPLTLDEGQKELLENLGELFLSEDTSDVDIVSGDRTFHCHELILAGVQGDVPGRHG